MPPQEEEEEEDACVLGYRWGDAKLNITNEPSSHLCGAKR